MVDDGRWQDGRIALLDFEDGQGGCMNGSTELNMTVKGIAPDGPFESIAFSIGVPDDLNHLDPVTARAPLNYTVMHWHWLSGYKFIRAAIGTEKDGFYLHLGSSRCDGSAAGFICKSPNRVKVLISSFDPARQKIIFDLKKLFEDIDLTDGIPGDCSSGPDQPSCAGPFRALAVGIDGASNRSSEVFRAGTLN
jgi:uncharacterized repeat protein (TIGR04052 family)